MHFHIVGRFISKLPLPRRRGGIWPLLAFRRSLERQTKQYISRMSQGEGGDTTWGNTLLHRSALFLTYCLKLWRPLIKSTTSRTHSYIDITHRQTKKRKKFFNALHRVQHQSPPPTPSHAPHLHVTHHSSSPRLLLYLCTTSHNYPPQKSPFFYNNCINITTAFTHAGADGITYLLMDLSPS